ncbi:hypothetical protein [Roseovarius sp. MMSF_3350]|uniref:hypothetical protein n=1 Tax=Roseovarius sp. MMSF_3350 TaxID=3046706 RepID=UPI00273D6B64|nr:hypothetical protein [Roseovarius sp. MMSF_3350]
MSRMNANIILAGQQPDLVNTLARSTEAAAYANANQRQNALTNLYQQHGAGIASGDQNALNALAGIDPMAAMDVQSSRLGMEQTRQSMQIDREKMGMLKEEAKRQARLDAAKLSADERAQAAEQLQGVLRGAAAMYQAGDRDTYNAWLQRNGLDPQQYPFEQFPAHLAQATGTIEALTEAQDYAQGPEPADEYGRYVAEERAAGREPLTRIEYNRSDKLKQNIEVGADGSVRLAEGFGDEGGGKPPSERQSTLRLFGGLMNETMPAINAMEDDPNFDPVSARSAAAGGGVLGNVVTSPEARRYEALKRQWAEGVLRIQTGAAATEPEIRRVMETYFPRYGDDPATIQQKREQRDAFARSLVQASGDTMQAPGGADTRGGIGGSQEAQPEQAESTGFTEVEIDGQKYRVKKVQ